MTVSAARSPNSADRTVGCSNVRERCSPSGTRGSEPSARARLRKCAVARCRFRTSPARGEVEEHVLAARRSCSSWPSTRAATIVRDRAGRDLTRTPRRTRLVEQVAHLRRTRSRPSRRPRASRRGGGARPRSTRPRRPDPRHARVARARPSGEHRLLTIHRPAQSDQRSGQLRLGEAARLARRELVDHGREPLQHARLSRDGRSCGTASGTALGSSTSQCGHDCAHDSSDCAHLPRTRRGSADRPRGKRTTSIEHMFGSVKRNASVGAHRVCGLGPARG